LANAPSPLNKHGSDDKRLGNAVLRAFPRKTMKPVLQTLILKRFRSIPAETVRFANPTFLVGRNGSGKSNFRDALDFLAEAMSSSLQSVFDRRGGIAVVRNRTSGRSYPPNLGLGVELRHFDGTTSKARYALEVRATKNYGFEVLREQCVMHLAGGATSWFDRRSRTFRSNVKGLKPALDPASLGLPVIGGEASFAPVLRTLAAMRSYSIEPGKLRELQDTDSGTGLKADGSNTASVLQEIGRNSPEDLERIGELLTTIVPNTRKVQTIKHGKKLTLEFTQEWGHNTRLKFESFSMSDGTLRALGLLAAVYQRPPPSVLLIEEPEATIHPGALGAILDLLRHASRHMQVIVTTHSPEVLDADWLEEKHLRIVDWKDGATRILPLATGTQEALREHLMSPGELLRSNALWPTAVAPGTVPETRLFEDVPS
jgi:predicted ATPase